MESLPRLGDLTRDQLLQHRSLDFCRWLSCSIDHAITASVAKSFQERWPRAFSVDLVTKAAVAAGTTTDATWAGPLFTPAPLADAFIALARSASLLGRIPGLRTVPFHVRLPLESVGASFAWVGQGLPKPVSKVGFVNGVTLGPTKAAGIVPVTAELAKLTTPGTEGLLRSTLIAGVTEFTDQAFLDPASTTIADVRPGSITSGATPITATADLAADVGQVLDALYTARPNAEAVLIMSPKHAKTLAGPTGQGTRPYGIPIVTTGAAGANVVAVDPKAIFVADAGALIEVSTQAMIEMVDNPATPTAASVMTSFFQSNIIGFRVERIVNWEVLTGGCQYVVAA